MNRKRSATDERVAELLRKSIKEGTLVDIEDFGTFLPGPKSGFRFIANDRPLIFIAYVHEDLKRAQRLYADLQRQGMNPWLDKNKLLPGQNWPRAIERAIGTADFFVPCFSKNAASKRGVFQAELRYALECANRIPLDEIFLIPVRMDGCAIPEQIRARIQCIDLFLDWEQGVGSVLKTIQREVAARRRKKLLPA